MLFILSSVIGAVASSGMVTVRVQVLPAPLDLAIHGAVDGGVYRTAVIPYATSSDSTASFFATLNGQYFVLGTAVLTEGTHVLSVTATNGAGASVRRVVTFVIDYTPPTLFVSGVDDGLAYNHAVTPTFETDFDASIVALLNGEPFRSGTRIEYEGTYTLQVTATDPAGNATTRTLIFTIDMTPPDIHILGVSDGRVYGRAVLPSAFSSDDTAVLFATLNGDPFTLGTIVVAEGSYVLVVAATDPAGNVTTKSVVFEIDYSVQEAALTLAALPERFAIALEWDSDQEEGVHGYRVRRALSAIELLEAAAFVETTATIHLDETVTPGTTYYYWVFALDSEGNEVGESNIVSAAVDPRMARLWGDDRIMTSVDISRTAFDSADTVIVATSHSFADAFSASGLAGSYRAPILLSRSGSISGAVQDEIERLGASNVLIVGGERAVGPAVERALFDMGLSIRRLAGATRYETAIAIAGEIRRNERAEGRPANGQVFLARGDRFPDALSVSPLAYSLRVPVLFARPDSLPDSVNTYASGAGFTNVVVLGGVAAVSDEVVGQFVAATGASSVRVGGTDRYETSGLVSAYGVEQGWASYRSVSIATGRNFPDALSGSAHAGEMGAVLILTPPDQLSTHIRAPLSSDTDQVFEVSIYGGTLAVNAEIEEEIRALLNE